MGGFDLFGGVWTLVQDMTHGGGYILVVHAAGGWSGAKVEGLLRSRGIETWGAGVFEDDWSITVPKAQAQWATYVLEAAGLSVDGGTTGALPFLPGGSLANSKGHELAPEPVRGRSRLWDLLDGGER